MALLISLVSASCGTNESFEYLSKDFPAKSGSHKQVIQNFYHKNVIGFENSDQTEALYVFSSPVYINNNTYQNKIQPITGGDNRFAYQNIGNDIISFLPDKLSSQSSFLIQSNNTEMELFPQSSESKDARQIKYINAFGKSAEHLYYENAFESNYYVFIDDFGIDTETVISNTKINTMEYIVEMDNVTVDTTCPDYVLFRSIYDESVKGIIYKPTIIENGKNVLDGVMTETCDISVNSAGEGRFTVTITLNDTFTEKAKYPLKINQSFHLYKPKEPDSAIYSDSSFNYYLNDKVVLGNDPQKGEGQLLVRFENLDFIDISPQDILSAEYIISEISGTSQSATIAMYPVVSEWCSLNVRWNVKPIYSRNYVQRITVNKRGDYHFDITELLQRWLENKGKEADYIIRNGLVLVNETPDIPKLFATGDNGVFTTCLKIKIRKGA